MMENTKRVIAGPFAVESQEQVWETIDQAKLLCITMTRLNLWKPRTEPGFEGVGEAGIPWVQEAAEAGLDIAMEVLNAKQLELLVENIVHQFPHAHLLAWIGSRNQNHEIQQQIGAVGASEPRVSIMVKNQMWPDIRHWKGIVSHLKHMGMPDDRLLLCHRGFALEDNKPLRNTPNWKMAHQIQEDLGLPMLVDPSHIGGRQDLVMQIAQEAALEDFDGQIVEVHPDPWNARTDAPQQLDWDQMTELLPVLTTQVIRR